MGYSSDMENSRDTALTVQLSGFKKWLILLLVWLPATASTLLAQHQETNEKPGIWKGKEHHASDSGNLLHAFKHGTFHGHLRNFTMATDNAHGLTDYFANASGGGIRYETAMFRRFQFAVSGFFVFNTGSVNLEKTDTATGQLNRYEIGLFDIEDFRNKQDIDRLEELYLRYHFGPGQLTAGRMLVNTPFVNLQDGRMRPTGVEGLWYESHPEQKLHLEGGWLYAISPRSTTKWYSIPEAMGLYPSGVGENGNKSDYHDHLESKGLFMAGIRYPVTPKIQIQAWNMMIENILNSGMLRLDADLWTNAGGKWIAAAQFIRQDAIHDGGHPDPEFAYIHKGGKSMAFGFRFGYKGSKTDFQLNYNRITAHGRYLMPREFGRDPFFTFMARERNEGAGDVHAAVLSYTRRWLPDHTSFTLAAGYYRMPDVLNFRLNKYGMPSYAQFNADLRHKFAGQLEGFEVQALVVGKINAGKTYENPVYLLNKTDMIQYNLVLNYHF